MSMTLGRQTDTLASGEHLTLFGSCSDGQLCKILEFESGLLNLVPLL